MSGVKSQATSGFGTIISIGDRGAANGTKASKTIGTVNQQLTVSARIAGPQGNTKTFGIVVAAGTVAYSQVITPTSVVINPATTSGTVTTKVGQAISNLYQDPIFRQYFDASAGSGDGSGLLVAGASAALTSGAEGAQIFTALSEIGDVDGPKMMRAFFERTHQQSVDGFREYGKSLKDSGPVTIPMNFINDVAQQAVFAAYNADVLDDPFDWRIDFFMQSGQGRISFSADVDNINLNWKKEAAKACDTVLKVTGAVSIDML